MHQVIALAVKFDRQRATGACGAAAFDSGVRMQARDVSAQCVARIAENARWQCSFSQGVGLAVFGQKKRAIGIEGTVCVPFYRPPLPMRGPPGQVPALRRGQRHTSSRP